MNRQSPVERYKSLALSTVLIAGAFAPLAYLVSLIATNYIGTPFADTWSVYYRIARFMNGGSTLAEFLFPQYNEARPVVPRLILFLVHSVNRSLVIDVALNIGAATGTAIATLLIARKTNPKLSWTVLLAVAVLFNLNFFSLAQWKNWNWHTQLMMFLPNLFFAIGWLVNLSSLRPLFRGALVSLCCALSTFSFANGLCQWFVLVPITAGLDRREKIRLWSLHVSAAVLCFIFYFADFKFRKAQALGAGLQDFGKPITYILAWLGSSLSGGSLVLAQVWGAILLLTLLFFGFRWILSWKAGNFQIEWLPWFSMGGYALMSGLLVVLGRSRGALEQALQPRYCTVSQWAIIAVIGLCLTSLRQSWERESRLRSWAFALAALLVGALLFFLGREQPYAVNEWKRFAGSMHFQKQSFGLEKAHPGQLWTFEHPNKRYVWVSYQTMLKAGFLRDFYRSGRILPVLAKNQTGDPRHGELEFADYISSRQIACRGWSIGGYPSASNRVLIVLIAPANGRVLAVADGPFDRYRPDTWRTKKLASRKVAGFDLQFSIPQMEPGEYRVAAFRYGKNEQTYYPVGVPKLVQIPPEIRSASLTMRYRVPFLSHRRNPDVLPIHVPGKR